jgi:hypothetical protein
LVFWLVLGAPLPLPPIATTRPLTPNASIPTFEQSRRDSEQARREGPQIQVDPAHRAMRDEIIRTGRNLQSLGCNEPARREFATAVVAALRARDEEWEADRRGRPAPPRVVLGAEAEEFVNAAIEEGVLRAADMPRGSLALRSLGRIAQRNTASGPDRFGCRV